MVGEESGQRAGGCAWKGILARGIREVLRATAAGCLLWLAACDCNGPPGTGDVTGTTSTGTGNQSGSGGVVTTSGATDSGATTGPATCGADGVCGPNEVCIDAAINPSCA